MSNNIDTKEKTKTANNRTATTGECWKSKLPTNHNHVLESPIQITRTARYLSHHPNPNFRNVIHFETAKLVYDNQISKPDRPNSHMKTSKKSDEHNNLKASSSKEIKPDKQIDEFNTMENTESTKMTTKMVRSKSDINFEPKANIPPEKGTLTSRTVRWKSTVNIPTAVVAEPKKKSYDREEARRFMEEQKKKRKSMGKENNKNEIDRDEIKKRLEILQKNTKDILNKNVKTLARKRVSCVPKDEEQRLLSPTKNRRLELVFKPNPARVGIKPFKDLTAEQNKQENVQPGPIENNPVEKCPDNDTSKNNIMPFNAEIASDNQIKNETIPQCSKDENNISKPKTPPLLQLPLNKKMGLLRKSESVDNSFSALNDIKSDQENAILNMINSNKKESIIPDNSKIKVNDVQIENKNGLPSSRSTSKSSFTVKASKRFSNELQLDIPECTLRTNLSDKPGEREPPGSHSIVFRQNEEIPYWLKPNPVQVYPYNFIMAVRKKLEAITNPVLKTTNKTSSTKSKDDNLQKLVDSTPVSSYRKDKRFMDVKRRLNSADIEPSICINSISSGKSSSYSFLSEKLTTNKSKNSSSSKNSGKNSQKLSESVCLTKSLKNNDDKSSRIHNASEQLVDNARTYESNNSSSKIKTFDLPNHGTYNKFSLKIDDSLNKIKDASKSLSEITSNFSSISIHVPESNTVSEVSSIRSETNHVDFVSNQIKVKKQMNDDDELTTASSSVFSSPEKKSSTIAKEAPLSPLSVENISNLKVKSSVKLGKIPRGITVNRENCEEIPPLNFGSHHTSDYNSTSERSDVNFNQLLEDFNRSLSQVIDANDQLKGALNKTDQVPNSNEVIRQHNAKQPNLVTVKSIDDYLSDFEDLLSSMHISNSQNEKNTETSSKITKFNSDITTLKSPENLNSSRASVLESIQTNMDKLCQSHSEQTESNVRPVEPLYPTQSSSNKSSLDDTNQRQSSQSPNQISKKSSQSTDQTIAEEINEYSHKENMAGNTLIEISPLINHTSINQFSKDSLDIETDHEDSTGVSKANYIKSHINATRGDFFGECFDHKAEAGPPGYNSSENLSAKNKQLANSSVGSDVIAIFNQSDVEMSVYSHSRSETTINYSSIGMYEQLIQSESNKSDQLASLLKMREKAILDRTKGQIAWLELQKERYKSKGLIVQISAVKKKQRAVLMKMEREREEIKKLLKIQTIAPHKPTSSKSLSTPPQQQISNIYHPKLVENLSDVAIRKSFSITGSNSARSNGIVRGYELEGGKSVELLLQKREEELRKRRAHVEKLMEWHQRLDQEEQEVLQLEQLLLECNDQQQNKENTQNEREMKKERKLKEIDSSLRELSVISNKSAHGVSETVEVEDFVRTTGSKLNKLWRRLTSQKLEKFEPAKKYKLCKGDLEKLYEEAKATVLSEFGNKNEMNELLNKSNSCLSVSGGNGSNSVGESQLTSAVEETNVSGSIIPKLNLNFSSGQSENEYQDNYSPSLAEEQFLESLSSHQKDNETKSSIANNTSPIMVNTNTSENILQLNSVQGDGNDTEIESFISNKVSDSNDTTSGQILTLSKAEEIDHHTLSIESTDSTLKSENKMQIDLGSVPSNKTTTSVDQIKSQESSDNTSFQPIESLSDPLFSTSIEKISEKINRSDSLNIDEPQESFTLESEPKKSLEQENKLSQSSSTDKDIVTSSKISTSEILNTLTDTIPTITNQNELSSDDLSGSKKSSEHTENKSEEIISEDINSPSRSSVISSHVSSPTEIPKILDASKINSKDENHESQLNETLKDSSSSTKNTPSDSDSKSKEIETNSGHVSSYENDFSYGEDTFLDDITIPKFETTSEDETSSLIHSASTEKSISEQDSETLEKRLICLDISLKGLQNTFDRALSPEKMHISPSQPNPPPFHPTVQVQAPTKPVQITNAMLSPPSTFRDLETEKDIKSSNTSHQQILNKDFNKMAQNSANNLMPDIISEVEIRRQQILLENEIKQLEQAVPYNMYLREIPNKPPPPYIPPAHGSPMTTIFPSEQRIQEITYRRTKELYDEIIQNEIGDNENKTKPPSVLDENITNIYERIILDICKECITDYQSTLTEVNPENYKNPLAFYNPPNRSKCMQNFVYKQVRKFLAMDKCRPKRNSIFGIGRRKRDHVDEILVQELYEEESKWTNFDLEEIEVKTTIIDEICVDIVRSVVDEVVESHKIVNSNVDSESINTT